MRRIGALVGLMILGCSSGPSTGSEVAVTADASSLLVKNLEVAALTTLALTALDEDRPELARKLLTEMTLSSLSQGATLVEAGAAFDPPVPNLRSGVEKALEYAEAYEWGQSAVDNASRLLLALE